LSVSEDFVNKYSAQAAGNADALGIQDKLIKDVMDIPGALAATVTDVGTSLWNSIIAMPKMLGVNTDEYRASTYDILRNVNQDWARFYTENEESVQTASFIGGVVLPAGAAFKGMKMLQAGKNAFYPTMLSDTAQAARITELERMLETGGKSTSAFRNLRWKVLGANAGQETMQAAGMELAVIATLNDHPWMEDYLKDPVTNFTIGLGIGGILGSGLGQIAIRRQLAERLGAVASVSTNKVISQVIDIPLGASDVDKAQRYNINAKILRDLAEDETESQLTRDIASSFATRWEGMVGELEQTSVFGPGLKGLTSAEAKQQAREIMLSDAAFGANRVDVATFEEKEFVFSKAREGDLISLEGINIATEKYKDIFHLSRTMRYSIIATEYLKQFKPNWAKLMDEQFSVYYSPYHKAWIPKGEFHRYARAVDTGRSNYEIVNVMKPHGDASFEYAVREIPTSKADKYWIDTLGSVGQVGLQRVVNIAESDLGRQNAWLSRLQEMATKSERVPEIRIVPDGSADKPISELTKSGRLVDAASLERILAGKKEQGIKSLLEAGASLQEIGIRLNIPVATIERHLLEKTPLQELGLWRSYSNFGAIQSEYLAPTTRSLQFTTNGTRLASLSYRTADSAAILDNKFIRQQNKEQMANTIASSSSAMARQFFQVLDADAKHWDIFSQQLANIVNEKSGSFFFSSADFASRRMGDISALAATKGQAWVGIVNNISQEMLTPLSARVRTQTTTQVGLNEFNDVINALQATQGFRSIDLETGQLYKLVETDPGVFIREPIRRANGTLVEMSESMTAVLMEAHKVGREMYSFKNTINKIQGYKELNDIGLWLPTFNPVNKFISYVIDTEASAVGSRVKLLAADTPEKLADLEKDWLSKFGATTGANKRYNLVTKAEQEDYNFWQMRQDPIEMDLADISKFHSGASASALPVFDDTFANTLIENLHNRVIFYGRKMQELYLEDIMSQLDTMSAMNQKFTKDQPTILKAVGLAQREDAARSVKNMLLGNNQLDGYTTWKTVNNGFSSMMEWASRKTQEFYRGNFTESVNKDGTVAVTSKDYTQWAKEMETVGLRNPFKDFNDYVITQEKSKIKWELVRDEGGDNTGRYYTMKKDGKAVGYAEFEHHGDTVHVNIIHSEGGPRSLGLEAMREIGQLIKREFPGATKISGERVSGVRAKAFNDKYDASTIETINQLNADDILNARQATASIPGISPSTMRKRHTAPMVEEWQVTAVARKNNISYSSAEQLVAAGNGVLATLALRVLETGQAFVTAVSWPIMTMPEISRALPKTFLGNALGEGVEVAFPTRVIYDGIRFRHSDAAQPHIKRWIEEGFGKSIVSEATRLNELLHTGAKGAVGKINSILESDLIKKLSTPSDFMEGETRLWVLSTGYQLARRMYPGISNADADIFAKQFLLRSIGNYYSAQRPAMFQGTFGVAIGLFQTYMLSWAQSAFRSLENREFKALAQQMLTQQALFGMGSEPLYDTFSKTIGEHFSDKHYDLTTGTYRALPHSLAEYIVYGLPASLGVGLYTRGDMQPRIPFTQTNPLDTIAAINASRQIIGTSYHTIEKVLTANGMVEKGRAMLEGLAMQSISRPLARIVEVTPVPNGEGGFEAVGSISREGNTIATSDEIWSGPALASRLIASRSSEEQIRREADYLNSFYGAVDHRHRKKATETLKTAIRAGNLSDETMTQTAAEYMRTGSATGWNAALNEALATSEGGIDYKLGKRLRPDSPLQKMLKDNF